MLELAERLKVMQKERETDKTVILRQQEIIDKYAGQEMRDTESKGLKNNYNNSTDNSED